MRAHPPSEVGSPPMQLTFLMNCEASYGRASCRLDGLRKKVEKMVPRARISITQRHAGRQGHVHERPEVVGPVSSVLWSGSLPVSMG